MMVHGAEAYVILYHLFKGNAPHMGSSHKGIG